MLEAAFAFIHPILFLERGRIQGLCILLVSKYQEHMQQRLLAGSARQPACSDAGGMAVFPAAIAHTEL